VFACELQPAITGINDPMMMRVTLFADDSIPHADRLFSETRRAFDRTSSANPSQLPQQWFGIGQILNGLAAHAEIERSIGERKSQGRFKKIDLVPGFL
jgi:hypothetical protein